MVNAALPGTVVILAATVLLILATVTTPINKSYYFLEADLSTSVESVTVAGTLRLGTFGFCVQVGATTSCSPTALGYSLDVTSLFGIDSDIASRVSGLSGSVIKWLTYVLVLHPIAAALAGAALLSGLLSHIREYSRTCFTSCFSSMATAVAFLAFLFDIIVFSIAKSRINSSSVGGRATLGSAIWMTLAAACLLAVSGCFFCAGRCLMRKRRTQQDAAEKLRPAGDLGYADQMRLDAEYAEKRRAEDANRRQGNRSNLPAFAEFSNEEMSHEAIPLTRMQHDDDRYGYSDGHNGAHRSPSQGEVVQGVGVGYMKRNVSRSSVGSQGRTDNHSQPGSHISNQQRRFAPSVPSVNQFGVGGAGQQGGTYSTSRDPYDDLPAHVEPALPYMSPRLEPALEDQEGEDELAGGHSYHQQQRSYQDPYAIPVNAPAPSFPNPQEPYHSSAHYRYNPSGGQSPPPSNAVGGGGAGRIARGYDGQPPTWYPTYPNTNDNNNNAMPDSQSPSNSRLLPPPPLRSGSGDAMAQSGYSNTSHFDQFATAPQTPMSTSYLHHHHQQQRSPTTGSSPLPPLPTSYDKRNYPLAEPSHVDETEALPRYQ